MTVITMYVPRLLVVVVVAAVVAVVLVLVLMLVVVVAVKNSREGTMSWSSRWEIE